MTEMDDDGGVEVGHDDVGNDDKGGNETKDLEDEIARGGQGEMLSVASMRGPF